MFRPYQPRQRRQAFTLLEVSIALALTGIVMGSLWTVYKGVSTETAFNQGSDDLRNTVTNVRALYAGLNTSFGFLNGQKTLSNPLAVGDVCYYMNPAHKSPLSGSGVFPPDMHSPANDPWSSTTLCPGSGFALGSAGLALSCSGSCTASSSVLFVVRYGGLPVSACANMLNSNSTPGPDTGLVQIVVNSGTPITLPATVNTLTAACSGATTYTIDWYYQLSD